MKKLFALAFFSLTLFGLTGLARADVNDFTINNFHTDFVIYNDDVGGSLQTNETINLTFADQNHGILRAIPKNHQGYDTKIKILGVMRDGDNEPYTTYGENGNLVLKIGDANQTITGKHTYKIVYTQEKIINFKEGQQFYWDVNGNGWQQSFENVSATVFLQVGKLNSANAVCYTGYQGSREKNCQFTASDNSINFTTNKSLEANQGLTIGVNIDGVVFKQPAFTDKVKDNLANIIGLVLGLVLSTFSYRYWRANGKDYKGKGTIIPEYEPPKDLTPAEVGMLADYRVDGKDMSATLIDLAVRGYIKIHQETKKIAFFKSNKFSLELLKADFNGLKAHEKGLIDGIFSAKTVGEIMEVTKINRSQMSKAVTKVNKDVKDSLTKTYGLIDEKSYSSQVGALAVGFAVGTIPFFIAPLPTGFKLGFLIAGVTTVILGFLMQRRTHSGVETYEKIKGLEMYMNVAEKDRLKMMQSVDRPYVEPAKTAELFEKLLPFAVALGVEKSWTQQFDGILTQWPDWISSNNAVLSGAYLASSIGGISTSFSSSFESSSGVSGGGSGGGGGGGGGGGW